MFPVHQAKRSKPEKRLLAIYDHLPETERKTLLDFAEFLAERATPVEPAVPQQPLEIPRPEGENVVAAMKRLRATYPMLDHSSMLNDASGLMAQHMMQGRPAVEVIDELEALFMGYYKKHRGDNTEEA